MKLKTVNTFALGVISALAINTLAQGANPKDDGASFRIDLEVLRAENGVRLTCAEGCVWETLSFTCDSNRGDCQSSFDEYGMAPD